jgi:hypothetical protein
VFAERNEMNNIHAARNAIICAYYQKGVPIIILAQKFKLTFDATHKVLQRSKIPMRSSSNAQRQADQRFIANLRLVEAQTEAAN